jgi:acetyl esterase/lipase
MKWCFGCLGIVLGLIAGFVVMRLVPASSPYPDGGVGTYALLGEFGALDANRDGLLSFDELPAAQRYRFNRMDTNNDGFLSRPEVDVMPLRDVLNRDIPAHPRSVELFANIPYAGTEDPRQMLDLMLPINRGRALLPVIVYVHGGGWMSGDKWQAIESRFPYVESGKYAVVSLGYRLTDQATWPAQIHDCKAAIRWIRANAAHYGLDPDRIGVWGMSAGGHLAAMLGTSADSSVMNGDVGPYAEVSSEVACVVDYFGPTDLQELWRTGEGAKGFLTPLLGGRVDDRAELATTANPMTYLTSFSNAPPFLIVHGTRDRLVPIAQSRELHALLAKSDVASTLLIVDGGGHGEGFGPEAFEETKRFFDHHLLGEPSDWTDRTIPADGR